MSQPVQTSDADLEDADLEDADLEGAVKEELALTPEVDSTHIGVAVDDRIVTLSGEVATHAERLQAGRAAQRVRGVAAIAQEISVRKPGVAADDVDVARESGAAIERAVDVPASVRVAVHEQVVTLTGEVRWQCQREAAGRTVRNLRGVVGVANLVTLRPAAPLASSCTAAITAALVRSARIDSKRITVTTDADGTATVEGTVASWAEWRQAEHACWAAPGVTRVVNKLHIRH